MSSLISFSFFLTFLRIVRSPIVSYVRQPEPAASTKSVRTKKLRNNIIMMKNKNKNNNDDEKIIIIIIIITRLSMMLTPPRPIMELRAILHLSVGELWSPANR